MHASVSVHLDGFRNLPTTNSASVNVGELVGGRSAATVGKRVEVLHAGKNRAAV